jgi:hypothetical protein
VYEQRSPLSGTIIITDRAHLIHAINDCEALNLEIRDNNDLTALHLVAVRSVFEVATLVAVGANLSYLTEDSQNVLRLSCRARQPNIVCQILSNPGPSIWTKKTALAECRFITLVAQENPSLSQFFSSTAPIYTQSARMLARPFMPVPNFE